MPFATSPVRATTAYQPLPAAASLRVLSIGWLTMLRPTLPRLRRPETSLRGTAASQAKLKVLCCRLRLHPRTKEGSRDGAVPGPGLAVAGRGEGAPRAGALRDQARDRRPGRDARARGRLPAGAGAPAPRGRSRPGEDADDQDDGGRARRVVLADPVHAGP